jgi:hypothetical protein
MVYQLDLRKCIYQLVGQMKKYEIYQLFKDRKISKFTIKDFENGLPCVSKPKIAKPSVADSKKVRRVLQSIKSRVGASLRLVVRTSHTTVFRILKKKNDVTHKKRVKSPRYCRFLLRKHFCDKKVIMMDDEKYFTFSP